MKQLIRSVLASAVLVGSLSASQAAVQAWNVSGTLDSGHYAGQSFLGTFSFDDALLMGTGQEWLAVDALTLSFAGTSFTLADADGPTEVAFSDGAMLGLSFSASAKEPQITFVPGFTSLAEAFVAYDTSLGLSGAGDAVLSPVPEPESIALMLAGLGVVGLLARRRVGH